MRETAIRTSVWRGRHRAAAVSLNAMLFLFGVYSEAHPRDRRDLWSAAAIAGVAVINSAALTVPAIGVVARFVMRLRRIAVWVNGLLIPLALGVVTVEGLHDWKQIALHVAALLVLPIVTLTALVHRGTEGAEQAA